MHTRLRAPQGPAHVCPRVEQSLRLAQQAICVACAQPLRDWVCITIYGLCLFFIGDSYLPQQRAYTDIACIRMTDTDRDTWNHPDYPRPEFPDWQVCDGFSILALRAAAQLSVTGRTPEVPQQSLRQNVWCQAGPMSMIQWCRAE